jgi:hypothetical protein
MEALKAYQRQRTLKKVMNTGRLRPTRTEPQDLHEHADDTDFKPQTPFLLLIIYCTYTYVHVYVCSTPCVNLSLAWQAKECMMSSSQQASKQASKQAHIHA